MIVIGTIIIVIIILIVIIIIKSAFSAIRRDSSIIPEICHKSVKISLHSADGISGRHKICVTMVHRLLGDGLQNRAI